MDIFYRICVCACVGALLGQPARADMQTLNIQTSDIQISSSSPSVDVSVQNEENESLSLDDIQVIENPSVQVEEKQPRIHNRGQSNPSIPPQDTEFLIKTGDIVSADDTSPKTPESLYDAAIIADYLGLYTYNTGGVAQDFWDTYSYDSVVSTLQNMQGSDISYVYTQALNRIVLSGTTPPSIDFDSQDRAGDIFRVRLDALMRAGRLHDIQTMLSEVPYDIRVQAYGDILARVHIALFDNASLCGLYNAQSDTKKQTDFWIHVQVLCLALDGNVQEIKPTLHRISSPIPEGYQELLEYGLEDTPLPEGTLIDVTMWAAHFMRAMGFGVDMPQNVDMVTYYALLQNLAIPDAQRAYYVYRLFLKNAVPLSLVDTVYKTIPVPESLSQDILDDGDYLPVNSHLSRAIAYQNAVSADAKSRVDIILAQVESETDYMDRMTTIRIFAPLLHDVTPFAHMDIKRIASILYASGRYDLADTWASQAPMVLWYERTLHQIYQEKSDATHNVLIGNMDMGCMVDIAPLPWMEYVYNTTPNIASYRISEAFATFESMGCVIPDIAWETLADKSLMLMQDIIAPAHMWTFKRIVTKSLRAVPIIQGIRPFVERPDISHMEMAKIYTELNKIGYGRLAVELAYERNTYLPW